MKVVLNETARIELDERGAAFGRRVTVHLLNNGGLSVTTLYFYSGKLYEQSAMIFACQWRLGDAPCHEARGVDPLHSHTAQR
jgi:hypothetical protein